MRVPARRIVVPGAVTVAVVSAVVAYAAIGSAAQAASVASPTRLSTTLSFVSHDEPGNEVLVDLGPKSAPGGPDIGDLLSFTQGLTTAGRSVGQIHVVAVGVDHKRGLSEATGTIDLADGSIQVGGIVNQTATFTLAVTGGTGAYAGAAGSMAFDASTGTQAITVHLAPRP